MLCRPALIFALTLGLAACGSSVALHAPTLTPTAARSQPAKLDLEPITARSGAEAASTVALGHPGPAEVLTGGMQSEIAGRALEGGDPGGYRVRCALDRFALRTYVGLAGTSAVATLYVDLGCSVERVADRITVWRGALRGRAMARDGTALGTESALVQRLADRTMSDASRELVSDLVVRVLSLGGVPSTRVFPDEQARAASAGIDDTVFGPAALTEASDRAPSVGSSLGPIDKTTAQAASWNAIAMAAGPEDPPFASAVTFEDDPVVRYYQYKALARQGSAQAMGQLKDALPREEEAWLAELVKDTLAIGGIGLARRR
jgi:hypothetical protein